MILYHPATDFYHCWMRFAYILTRGSEGFLEYERARIIDYYLCFPKELLSCKLVAQYSAKIKKGARLLPESYEDHLSVSQAFRQMSEIHRHVVMDMASKGIIDRDSYRDGKLEAVSTRVTDDLLAQVSGKWRSDDQDWRELVITGLKSMSLNGKGGLKDRSGLLEYRYDG